MSELRCKGAYNTINFPRISFKIDKHEYPDLWYTKSFGSLFS